MDNFIRDCRRLYESMIDAFVMVDMAGNITEFNSPFVDMVGYSPDEIYALTYLDLTPEKWHKMEEEIVERQILPLGYSDIYEKEYRRKDGSIIPVELRANLIRNTDNIPVGMWAIVRDISERKQLRDKLEEMVSLRTKELEKANRTLRQKINEQALIEGELRKLEERYRLLDENATDMIVQTDAKGAFTYVSQAVKRYGYKQKDMLGKPFYEFFVPEQRNHLMGILMENVEDPHEVTFEGNMLQPGKDPVCMEISAAPIIRDGILMGYQAISRNIEDRKRIEAELQRAIDTAEQASRAKSEFLANMSHEIRTPMNGIIGMTELALDTPLKPEQRDFLLAIRSSADTLLTVINDILDFSKIEARKLDIVPDKFNLRDCIADTMRSLAIRAHEKGLELVCDISPDVPDGVVGDANRLKQIIVNLAGNAIKFTEKGEVVVRTEVDSLSGNEVFLHFSVIDTGIGIPADKHPFIFEAFSQADSSTTRKYGGTGLGLAISSRIVEMMGGEIWLESEEGRGSTFHFTVKMGIIEGQMRMEKIKTANLENMRVLIVDDNATNRRILQEMLTRWGMKPTAVAGGREALEAMEEAKKADSPFKLVLLDACMPEMDGFTLAGNIKDTPGLTGSTVMMLSSATQYGDAAKCRELGISLHLVKPIKQSDLLNSMLKVLSDSASEEKEPEEAEKNRALSPRRILVAEDNEVNRKLISRIIEKQGHNVSIVNDGDMVLPRLREEDFDLVFMDVQMERMDGFAATAAVRKWERNTGGHIPIVAMTAHAMKGDREKCLDAGMDGYVSKPIKAMEIMEAINKFASASTESEPDVLPAFDSAAAVRRVGGDEELVAELAGIFIEDCPRMMCDIENAIENKDAKALESAAHSLKGSASNFAAGPVHEALLKLEIIGRNKDLGSADEAFSLLGREMEKLVRELAAFSGMDKAA